MEPKEDTPEDHKRRSRFVKRLVQSSTGKETPLVGHPNGIPKTIVQFWNNSYQLPTDVEDCIGTWKALEVRGYKHLLFNQEEAKLFISNKLGERHSRAFDKCYHPAMQSDYFRLCYIYINGGFYVDADDVYREIEIDHLFMDGRLKIQPLCYDIATGLMVKPSIFTTLGAHSPKWIFYFNNNPIIAPARHPIIDKALTQATLFLEYSSGEVLPEIQSTTGPGNLTKSIFELDINYVQLKSILHVLSDWENIATTKWDLSYRHDSRNWRLSNQKQLKNEGRESE